MVFGKLNNRSRERDRAGGKDSGHSSCSRFDLWTFQNFAGARVYDPTSQRWMEQDPSGFAAGDPDLYRYVGNAPTNESDPSGLQMMGPIPPIPMNNPVNNLPAPVQAFGQQVGFGVFETVVPGGPLFMNFPAPANNLERAGRLTGHLIGLGIGFWEIGVGANLAGFGGGGAVVAAPAGPVAILPGAVAVAGLGVGAVGVVTSIQAGILIANDIMMMMQAPPPPPPAGGAGGAGAAKGAPNPRKPTEAAKVRARGPNESLEDYRTYLEGERAIWREFADNPNVHQAMRDYANTQRAKYTQLIGDVAREMRRRRGQFGP